MRWALVIGGSVVNVVESDAQPDVALGLWVADTNGEAEPGGGYSLGVFSRARPAVPTEVTMRQARDVLIDMDLIDAVEAVIEAIEDPKAKRKARSAWDTSSTVQRGNGLLTQIAPILGLSDGELDDLFVEASKR